MIIMIKLFDRVREIIEMITCAQEQHLMRK